MSYNTKLTAVKRLVSELRKWPDDSQKIYASFRSNQIKRLDSALSEGTQSKLPSAENIEAQTTAAHLILEDKNRAMFAVGPKLLEPNGMPTYYERILREATRTTRKISFFTATKDSLFGWWK